MTRVHALLAIGQLALPASAQTGSLQWPVRTPRITQDYASYNDGAALNQFHLGIDMVAAAGEPKVYPIATGTVKLINNSCPASSGCLSGSNCCTSACSPNPCNCGSGFGNYVVVEHPQFGDTPLYSLYAHLKQNTIVVVTGQDVSPGVPLADIGNTGCSTAPHVHLQIREGLPSDATAIVISHFEGGYDDDAHPAAIGFPDPRCFFWHVPVTILTDGLNVRKAPISGEDFANVSSGQQFVAVAKYPHDAVDPSWWFIYLPDMDSIDGGDDDRRYGWIAARNPNPPHELWVQPDLNNEVIWVDGLELGPPTSLKVRQSSGTCPPVLSKVWGGQRFVKLGSANNNCGTGCSATWWKISLPDLDDPPGGSPMEGWICSTYAPAPDCPNGIAGCAPVIGLNPQALLPVWSAQNANATTQTFAITNNGGSTLSYSIADDVPWLAVSPSTGTTTGGPNVHAVLFSTAGLPPGKYGGIITIGAPGATNDGATYSVQLTITPEPSGPLAVTPTEGLVAAGNAGGPFNANIVYTLHNNGSAPLNWLYSNNAQWINPSSAAGTISAGASDNVTVALNANANAFPPGSHNATVAFTDQATGDTVTRSVELIVWSPAPAITTQPVSQIVAPGDLGSFYVAATGAADLYYQWRKAGVALGDGGNISGAQTNNLLISGTDGDDQGVYDVVVSNEYGTVASNSVTLAVGPAPGQCLVWTQRFTPTKPSKRWQHAMAFDQARQQTVLFGGLDWQNNDAPLGDTWEWDGTGWSLRSSGGPPARSSHGMAYNGNTSRVVLFGGRSATNALLNDTWEWNGNQWLQLSGGLTPAPRDRHAITRFSFSHAVMFGGYYETEPGAGTWTWNGTGWTRWLNQPAPLERIDHAMAFQPSPSLAVLFGGRIGQQFQGDTWRWFGNGWEQFNIPGPSPRVNHAMTGMRLAPSGLGAIVLFGGEGPLLSNETWLLTETPNGYSWNLQSAAGPIQRFEHAMAFHDKPEFSQKRVVLFGGMGPSGALDDTWELSLQSAPYIVQQPNSVIVNAGQAAIFSVTADGGTPLGYQWRRDGVDLRNGGAFSGTQSDTLTISRTTSDLTGSYDVIVSNSCGSVISNSAYLTVFDICMADVTGNGVVNVDDLLAVIGAWGPCGGCAADLTGNGVVNVEDLLAVIGDWGPCP